MGRKRKKNNHKIGNRKNLHTSGVVGEGPPPLRPREADDPMRLRDDVISVLKNYFLKSGTTLLPSQRNALTSITESILSAAPGTATAVPLVPGGGKSSLIRALLTVFSEVFTDMTNPLAQKLGGAIIVVEKSAEAHELKKLCNSETRRIAAVVEAPNDYNLRNGCPNGTATRYEECLRRACPDYSACPLAQAVKQTEETPILILLHARYQRHMEDMSSFLSWYDEGQEYHRTLLLVDELPTMFDDCSLCIATLNAAETELDQLKASYRYEGQSAKRNILFHWNRDVRNPFFKLMKATYETHDQYRLVSPEMREAAGFCQESLETLQGLVKQYAENTAAEKLVGALLTERNTYYATGQTFSIFLPRLKKLDTNSGLATFIFSGTAVLSPEVGRNPDIQLLTDQFNESYQRLHISVQRGDDFSASKTALTKRQNQVGVFEWLHFILPQLVERHKKILIVTYQSMAETLWMRLAEYQEYIIPYIDGDGNPAAKLPYFGGVNGSNLYQEATCVICVGLNRFEPREYLSRTLALDFTGEIAQEIQSAEEQNGSIRLDQLPRVVDMQDITLARDIVQLVFRSALRRHGETQPIELWLLHPPNNVLGYLQSYFRDCCIKEIPELPEVCRYAVASEREYMGTQTHAAKLLQWLKTNEMPEFTPAVIREQTGLALGQFKEAKKNPAVRSYFDSHIETNGSGKNTVYRKKAASALLNINK